MDFDPTPAQAVWKRRGEEFARGISASDDATTIVPRAAQSGIGGALDVLSLALVIEAIAYESAAAATVIAMHSVVAFATSLPPGAIGALALSSEDVPFEKAGRLSGRVSWVAPVTGNGVALVGARTADDHAAFALRLNAPGVKVEPVETAGLRGLPCAHLSLQDVEATPAGATVPLMSRVRVLMAAVGLGIGRRALKEALVTARAAGGGAAGEQTVQGLLADAATELDAAMLLTWKAATEGGALTLADASMAKLAATGAVQRAVERTTQVVGVETFRRGHVIERLAQDVRALELFAGRTEALRAAVAEDVLPNPMLGLVIK